MVYPFGHSQLIHRYLILRTVKFQGKWISLLWPSHIQATSGHTKMTLFGITDHWSKFSLSTLCVSAPNSIKSFSSIHPIVYHVISVTSECSYFTCFFWCTRRRTWLVELSDSVAALSVTTISASVTINASVTTSDTISATWLLSVSVSRSVQCLLWLMTTISASLTISASDTISPSVTINASVTISVSFLHCHTAFILCVAFIVLSFYRRQGMWHSW